MPQLLDILASCNFRLEMKGTQEFARKRLCCSNPICNIYLRTRKPSITLVHDDLVLLYLQQSATCPLLKDGRATLGIYRSCSCNSCVLSWNLDVSRYTSLGVLTGEETVIIHHAQTDLKLERTGKQDACSG